MTSSTRIVLASSDIAYEQRVRQAFGGALNGDLRRHRDDYLTDDPNGIVVELTVDHPDVVVLGPGVPLDDALEVARSFDANRPEISVVLVASPSPKLWEKAMRAGVRDVLDPDAEDAALRETFERALETAARRRSNLVGEPESESKRGRVITVVSPKGGSGKTTVATNLAVSLAAQAPGRVAICDLDLQFGDVGSALRLVPEHTIGDVAGMGTELDAMTLKTLLTPHPSELYVLCAPDSPAEGEEVSADVTSRAIRMLAAEFDYVVVDTSAGITEHALAAMEVSTDLLLMCAMDVPSVRGIRKVIEALDQLGMLTQRRHFLLNRADARVGLNPDDVEATVGMAADITVPSSRAVPLSMNQGSPVVEAEPRSPVSRQFRALADRFVDAPASRPQGLLRWRAAR